MSALALYVKFYHTHFQKVKIMETKHLMNVYKRLLDKTKDLINLSNYSR